MAATVAALAGPATVAHEGCVPGRAPNNRGRITRPLVPPEPPGAMLREHVAAWTTVAFAVLLLLLTITDQGGMAASLLILAWAIIMLALFVATEQAVHRRATRR